MSALLLKEATTDAHRRVESVFGPIILQTGLHPAVYLEILKTLYRVFSILEDFFLRYPQTAKAYQERSKLPWLLRDINGIDGSISAEEILDGGLDRVYRPANEAQAWGACYVVEGSTLGGKVIAENLSQLSWIRRERHLHYFSSYASERGPRWRQFTESLDRYAAAEPESVSEMIVGAVNTFQWMEAEFRVLCSGVVR